MTENKAPYTATPAAGDKPLHVRVAEALGCRLLWRDSPGVEWAGGLRPMPGLAGYWYCGCDTPAGGLAPHGPESHGIHEYDQSWLHTGPLIERIKPMLYWEARHGGWVATWPVEGTEALLGTGETALVAVCALILRAQEVGRLQELLAE